MRRGWLLRPALAFQRLASRRVIGGAIFGLSELAAGATACSPMKGGVTLAEALGSDLSWLVGQAPQRRQRASQASLYMPHTRESPRSSFRPALAIRGQVWASEIALTTAEEESASFRRSKRWLTTRNDHEP
jgi:hypothetical protein